MMDWSEISIYSIDQNAASARRMQRKIKKNPATASVSKTQWLLRHLGHVRSLQALDTK
jgi:hypothetical protein